MDFNPDIANSPEALKSGHNSSSENTDTSLDDDRRLTSTPKVSLVSKNDNDDDDESSKIEISGSSEESDEDFSWDNSFYIAEDEDTVQSVSDFKIDPPSQDDLLIDSPSHDDLRNIVPSLAKNDFPSDETESTIKHQSPIRIDQDLTKVPETLFGSLADMPTDKEEAEDPSGLKPNVSLFPHQRQALLWMLWRESKNPSGGILGDDMGLGKTLTLLSLILKQRENEELVSEASQNGLIRTKATLVICPASLMGHWQNEAKDKTREGVISVLVYHGDSKKQSAGSLTEKDLIITNYDTVMTEDKINGTLFSVFWDRIILDEAHIIRNPKSKTAVAVSKLQTYRRWAVSGTPIHNKDMDLYSLIRFIRLVPFDQYCVWKALTSNETPIGKERLNILVKSIMLRRTKDQKNTITGKAIVELPSKVMEEHMVVLSDAERQLYDVFFDISRQSMLTFIQKSEEKKASTESNSLGSTSKAFESAETNHPKVFRLLVLLTRLRQICCHPGLVKSNEETEDHEDESDARISFDWENPIFDRETPSSKVSAILSELMKLQQRNEELHIMEKVVIVSQWTSMLDILKYHIEGIGLRCAEINGRIPIQTRSEIVNDFNRKNVGSQVMLLSLAAGGVGLNLVGANHLYLVDIHWNPQLEKQACDRVHRIGQESEVVIHKFLCPNTIESNVLLYQAVKLELAEGVLSGAQAQSTKMSIDDLKQIFKINDSSSEQPRKRHCSGCKTQPSNGL